MGMPPGLAHPLLLAIVGASIALMLVRPRGLAEVYWVGGGVVLLLALGLLSPSAAGRAVAQGSDVYLFLTGMMLLSELAREHGVFDWVSSLALRHARGSRRRLFALVYAVGTAITVCLSNDATAVVLTPAILAAISRADVPPMPYLFACAMVANAASFVLPLSNPANLVVFRHQMPALPHWLAAFALPSALSIAVTYLSLCWSFRRELRGAIMAETRQVAPGAHAKLVLGGLVLVVAVLLAASAWGVPLGLPTCLAAVTITAVVSVCARANPLTPARRISWKTLILVAGLFVLVHAVESAGALTVATAALRRAQQLAPAVASLVVSMTVGVANNLVNNLPLGLLAGSTVQAAHTRGLLSSSVLVGVDLGPNLSVTGSLATILWLLALRRERLRVSALDFLKVGALAMPAALLAAWAAMVVANALF